MVDLPEPVNLLLVEDCNADADLTQRALLKGKIVNTLHRVCDGVEALAFLRREPPFENVPRPDMILLDLNMPRMDGNHVLREMENDPSLCQIPVVVLTTSDHDKDVLESSGLNTDAYIVKPIDVRQLLAVVQKTHGFWIHLVKQPSA